MGRQFRVTDPRKAVELLGKYNLGTLVTTDDDGFPRASTSPLIVREGANGGQRFYLHVDGRNPQAEHLVSGQPLLYVGQGPRAYMSPSWFPRRPAAPTYLHVTVQARGYATHLEGELAEWVLLETVSKFEERQAKPWRYDGGEKFLSGMARRIAAFEVTVREVEAACKLSQDRSVDERMLIAQRLDESASSEDRVIAQMIVESVSDVSA